MIRAKRAPYKHFGECLFVTNSKVEIIAACGFGIRILSYALCDGGNVFFEQPEDMAELTTETGWRIYGGHRLWISPESERDYYPDNQLVKIEVAENEVDISQGTDPWLGIKKEISLRFSDDAEVEVTHKITNDSRQTQELSLWAISCMAAGGTQKIRLPQGPVPWGPRLGITAWDYTNLGDPRVTYHNDCIELRQCKGKRKYKIGLSDSGARYEYRNRGIVFAKTAARIPGKQYPDGGMCYETFICDHMLEMETLSPVYRLAGGNTATHCEKWNIWKEEE